MTDISSLSFAVDDLKRIEPCLAVQLHLDRTDTAELLEFVDAAFALIEPDLTHYQTDTMKRPRKYDAKAKDIVGGWLTKPREFHPYQVCAWGDAMYGTTAIKLEVLLRYLQDQDAWSEAEKQRIRERRREIFAEPRRYGYPAISQVLLTLPVDHPLGAAGLAKWVSERPLVTRGRTAGGLCGYRLNRDHTNARYDTNERYRLAGVEHPGLDLDVTSNLLEQMCRYDLKAETMIPHIARVNWLTIVSERASPSIGDMESLARRLEEGPGVTCTALAHGLLVQAAPQPVLGDGADDPALAGYRHVARVLRPIRIPTVALGPNVAGATIEWFESLDANHG